MQKNTASPHAIYAKVVNATDGAPITTGVVAFHVQASTRAAVAGTAAAHIANGLWGYTPTQAETNYDTFAVEFYHTDAVGDGPCVQVVTEVTKALLDYMAPIIIGSVTGARTGTEVFIYDGVTATVTADSDGNRTLVFS
jgi:hypothetical protein